MLPFFFHGKGGLAKFKYRGKWYGLWRQKEAYPTRPIGEEKDPSQEIIAKDYNQWGWNATINANGETIVVEWGVYKHLTVWGSIILIPLTIYLLTRRYLAKKKQKEVKKYSKENKIKNEKFWL